MQQKSENRLYSGAQWVSACHFHELTERQVLDAVAARVRELKAKAGLLRKAHPLVLLDLDSTLYEVGPRSFQILREWMETDESLGHAHVRHSLQRLREEQVGYSIADTLRNAGLSLSEPEVEHAIRVMKPYWSERFFTSRYLAYDRPYPGAAEFTRNVHELGAEIVYLTGRDEPGMGEGTRSNLLRDGFPWEKKGTHLLLKKAAHLPDLAHKKEAAEYISEHGTLVASFENEPPNLIALSRIFPDAMHVFLDTVCSDHEAPIGRNLYRIRGFHHPSAASQ
jgi:phosphoglycolate phosphatase-like HAD superfamily hydrolase